MTTAPAPRSSASHHHRLWIDEISERLPVPTWGTAALLGTVSYAAYVVALLAAGADITEDSYGLTNFLPIVVLTLVSPPYIRNQMMSLEDHVLSMVGEAGPVSDPMPAFTSLKPVTIVAVALGVAFVLPFVFEPSGSVFSGASASQIALVSAPWIWVVFLAATTIWMSAYAMVGIYRMGKLPMKLRPFTQDRTLGFGPFASAALRVTGVYYAFVSVSILSDFLVPIASRDFVVIRAIGLVAIGLLLLFLPLLSLRKRLVEAKSQKLAWINQRFTRTVQQIESNDGPVQENLHGELSAIDLVRREIQSIKTWPFDVGFLAKVVTIAVSVTAILLSRLFAQLFGL